MFFILINCWFSMNTSSSEISFYLEVTMGFLVILVLLMVLYFVDFSSRSNSSTSLWSSDSRSNYLGIQGEYDVKNVLIKIAQECGEGSFQLRDILLSKNGYTSQIDNILVTRKAIYVIEVKNYDAWIFGNDTSKYWTRIKYEYKSKFYNPIW